MYRCDQSYPTYLQCGEICRVGLYTELFYVYLASPLFVDLLPYISFSFCFVFFLAL